MSNVLERNYNYLFVQNPKLIKRGESVLHYIEYTGVQIAVALGLGF